MKKLRVGRVIAVAGVATMLVLSLGIKALWDWHEEKTFKETAIQLLKEQIPKTGEEVDESQRVESAFYFEENDKIYLYVAGEMYEVDRLDNITEAKTYYDVNSLINIHKPE